MSKEKTVRVRRTFTPQFKKDALGLVTAGRSVTEVARDLGIAPQPAPAVEGADGGPRWTAGLGEAESHGRLRGAPRTPQQLRDVTEERDVLKKHGVLRGRPEVKFHFVEKYKDQFRIRSMCRILGVSRSGFYAWSGRPLPRRETRNEALVVQIRRRSVVVGGRTGPHGAIALSRRSAWPAAGTESLV